MKILAILTLFISFAVFAKPSIDYKYIPKDATILGYISSKAIMNNKHMKKFMKTKDAKKTLQEMKKMGININKIGAISFYSDTKSLMQNQKDMKNANYALILHGLSLEKLLLMQIKEQKDLKKVQTYKGIKIYKDLKVKNNEKGEFEAVCFFNSNTIMGSESGVKKVIDAYKGSHFTNTTVVNRLLSSLKSPEFFVINIVDATQRALIQQAVAKNQANPAVAMLGINALAANIELFAFSGNLTNKKLKLVLSLKADKPGVKNFVQTLNVQFRNFKPMLEQQITAYSAMIGKSAVKELKSILNSLKIVAKGKLALISIVIDIDNTMRVINELQKKQPGVNRGLGQDPNMIKMKR